MVSVEVLRREYLFKRLTCSQVTEAEAHGVVSEHGEEEHAGDEQSPDEDVGRDPSHEAVRVYHGSTVPQEREHDPRKRARDGRDMHERRRLAVPEVKRAQVEKVDSQDQLAPPKVAAGPEHDKGRSQQVVEDEVRADIGGGGDALGVAGEEALQVADLEDEQGDPVDAGQDGVELEGGGVGAVLAPDGSGVAVVEMAVLTTGGSAEGVYDADDDQEEPGGDGQELVDAQASLAVGFALCEGVDGCWWWC